MTDSLLVTPDTWFDVPRRARLAEAATPLSLTLAAADGSVPLAAVTLGELRALHQVFGAWWPELGAGRGAAGLADGAYDRFLHASAALLYQQAEAALAPPDGRPTPTPAVLHFPDLAHPWLADSPTALRFLAPFLSMHGPSLRVWAAALASRNDSADLARQHVWLRLVLQKVAVDDDVPDVVACLRQVYGDDAARPALRAADTAVLDQCDLGWLAWSADALGLDRPRRTGVGIALGERRAAGAAPPDVTVIVPSYQHGSYIEAALESVLAQTYTAFRVLVVDDGSPDDTVARARRFDDPRLRVEVNAVNVGLGDSVLRALESVDTPYVALLNSDDLFHPDRLERCRAAFDGAPARRRRGHPLRQPRRRGPPAHGGHRAPALRRTADCRVGAVAGRHRPRRP